MKLQLFFLLCLSGEVPIILSNLEAGPQLNFVQKVMNWANAQKYCKSMYSDLASGEDKIVLLKIIDMVKSKGMSQYPIWIGIYKDLNSWQWSFNNLSLTSTSFTNWNPGEPGNYTTGEECGEIHSSGYWEEFNCTALNPFICFKANNSGADRFVGVSSPQMTWADAQTYCRTFHTDLASVLNPADNDLLAQVASVQGTSWFGLYRGTWKWVENTVASDLQWSSVYFGRSNVRNCAALFRGTIALENCEAGHNFVCQSNKKSRKQIIKVQVQSDGFVLDPAGQAAILEKIKMKLETKGMVNTTVTWRVQQDGKIFHKKKKEDL